MENELNLRVGKYWLLYYQPLPEAGERIAIALVFENGRRGATLEYDPSFAKAAKVFPDLDQSSLKFFLDSLKNELLSPSSVEAILGMYGPQVAASTARKIEIPVTTSAIDLLMAKYVYPAKKTRSRERVDQVAVEIAAYVREQLAPDTEVLTNVAAKDIVGRAIDGARRIALAIHGNAGWTLVDGVDLNQLTPNAAAHRADAISKTFWKYGRAKNDSNEAIRRVGLVLNGNSHLTPKTSEAHDYALHLFSRDADFALDAASSESGSRLRDIINGKT